MHTSIQQDVSYFYTSLNICHKNRKKDRQSVKSDICTVAVSMLSVNISHDARGIVHCINLLHYIQLQ